MERDCDVMTATRSYLSVQIFLFRSFWTDRSGRETAPSVKPSLMKLS